ncbi:hypothetical protein, partial [Peterkaempfera griseoplana]|uniref:hypothetical protein n=1 Tax=Peterkaempfera griseoplana TaxID=66896 RepID=UPI0006E38684
MCQPGLCGQHTPEQPAEGVVGRRAVLRGGAALGAVGALTLAPLVFAGPARAAEGAAPAGSEVTREITGHLETG